MDHLSALQQLGESQRLAVIDYQKPGALELTRRWVEPYQLQHTDSALMVLCWQVDPQTMERTSWRNFRIDRMRGVWDGGRVFVPRMPVTLHHGESRAFRFGHQGELSAVNDYFQFLETAMLDGKISQRELGRAEELGRLLSVDQVRAVHAQIFAGILREVLIDGMLDDREAAYLVTVRKMLKKLGYSPGEKDSLE